MYERERSGECSECRAEWGKEGAGVGRGYTTQGIVKARTERGVYSNCKRKPVEQSQPLLFFFS